MRLQYTGNTRRRPIENTKRQAVKAKVTVEMLLLALTRYSLKKLSEGPGLRACGNLEADLIIRTGESVGAMDWSKSYSQRYWVCGSTCLLAASRGTALPSGIVRLQNPQQPS